MTKEDIAKVYADGFEDKKIKEVAYDAFLCGYGAKCDTELPQGLDEAAKEHSKQAFNGMLIEDNIDAFIAGAKWMAEQGVITEQVVGRTPLNGPNGVTVFLYDFDGFKAGDKVIVQIRKK